MGSFIGNIKSDAQVIIVGAGPVGMLTALRLGQAGIDTLVIEGHETLLNTTRAVVYMPVVIPVLRELGILNKVLQHAYLNTDGVTWRGIDGKALANLPLSSPNSNELDGVLMLGQWQMNSIIQKELTKYPSVQIRFGLKLQSIVDDPTSSIVTLTAHDTLSTTPESSTIDLKASYVLGSDGANSTTRHLLSLTFKGQTYDTFRIIGMDVLYDFVRHEGFDPLNFVVDPTDWAVTAYTGQNGAGEPCDPKTTSRTSPSTDWSTQPQWRVAYPESPDLPTDQPSILHRAEAQMSKYALSGAPWTLIRTEPYIVSQRCSSDAMVARVALAGDALHCNNPIGGLGLTGGILDTFSYGNAFVRVLCGGEGEQVLRSCAEGRFQVWRDVTDGMSRGNLERLYVRDEEEGGVARAGLFKGLSGGARDGVAEKVRMGIESMVGDNFLRGTERWVQKV